MKRTNQGFTLVELLVVISIIGILMGLLIPAVNAAREVARRNQCATNVKNFALSAFQYEINKKKLPGYVQSYGLFEGGSADPSDPTNQMVPRHLKLGTWAVALLPTLDAQPTYEHWTEDRYPIIVAVPGTPPELGETTGVAGNGFHTLAAPNLAIFQCPSNSVSEGSNAKNSYIYNNGMAHLRPDGSPISVTRSSGSSPFTFGESQAKSNGVGNAKYHCTNASTGARGFEGESVRMDDFKDGQSFTVLFSENVQALPWHRAGLINAPDLLVAGTDEDIVFTGGNLESARYIHGLVWHYEDADFANTDYSSLWNNLGGTAPVVPIDVESFHRINGGGLTVSDDKFTKTIRNLTDARNLARPSSAHVDGVNAGMADGATRFIVDSIDYRVYQALLTPRGKSSSVPWAEFVITDELGEL